MDNKNDESSKIITFRINNSILADKLCNISKEFENQTSFAQYLSDLIELHHRRLEIPEHETTINTLELKFKEITSLIISTFISNQAVENDIKKEFQEELLSKENVIKSLTDSNQKLNAEIDKQVLEIEQQKSKYDSLAEQLDSTQKALKEKKYTDEIMQNQLDNFNLAM